ncbi:bifunctional DNA-formamidopyrimidine glycosylase/DNA-(apurinic or apyrimidinic site) lyase [Anaerovorax odorimutans]|uniref:Formamidopyrimidine-DNA glycosylase n=1 Tax=Anaerovorax odorimutans TaxID=109327 RepID=A0ABT1RQD4_9FIRM|nr:bifunctional DNA-formamidopyrimidine glycosylase/DNA-(apurinic or apyrimidinic site) lyase [Anaerovorax odorimutans]MCQ4637374.1 bifunctional DNA-formamidopyrimidine glycosylase/DNA-(apurinic or apyrimidinic site) lyase [Anaerovorax odorimutans]
MPELPEVETVKRIIEPQIVGQKILSVTINHPQVIAYPGEHLFVELLTGQTVQSMSRRGKFLTIHFASGDRVVIHLRMTGQLLIAPMDYPIEKHTHFIAELSAGSELRYIDVRRFGRFWYLRADETDAFTGQDKLGLEPLDENLTAAYLQGNLGKRKKTIKEMLHDQSIVAGIGNIYSDEILFASGVYPKEKCLDLDCDDWSRIAKAIKEIIAWGIDTNEMTAEEYLAGKGKEYRNTPHLRVYGRSGQLCAVCQSEIEKITIGGRSSCYCPSCQMKKSIYSDLIK